MFFMDSTERELFDFVTEELLELAWGLDYPIHPAVSLQSFLRPLGITKLMLV